MRVDPLHLGDGALKFHRLLGVELRREGVVRERRHGGGEEAAAATTLRILVRIEFISYL